MRQYSVRSVFVFFFVCLLCFLFFGLFFLFWFNDCEKQQHKHTDASDADSGGGNGSGTTSGNSANVDDERVGSIEAKTKLPSNTEPLIGALVSADADTCSMINIFPLCSTKMIDLHLCV